MSDSTRFRGALLWSFVLNGGRQALASLFTLALAALIGPEDFGAVTIALTYVLFLQIFLDNGLGEAIVQRRDLDEQHLTAAFWMLVGASVLMVLASLGFARWWAAANRLPELVPVILALSLSLPLHALSVVQQALLRRRMDFRSLALLANGAVVAAGVLGLVLARRGLGVWALVAYQLAVPAATLVLYWTFTRWRPSLRISRHAARQLAGFSAGSLLAGFGSFVNTRADALIMGLVFGPAAVGAYRLAERLVALVIESAARPVQAVALPDFARVQDQSDALTASALRCIRVSALLTAAPLAVLAAGAAEVTQLVGPKWGEATGALRWLCLAGLGRSLVLFLGPLLVGVGRPQALAALLWGTALPSAAAVLLAAWWVRDAPLATQAAAIGASRAALFVLVVLPIAVFAARRLVALPREGLFAALAPSLGAAAVGAGAVLVTRLALDGSELGPNAAALAVLGIGAAAGAVALLLLDRSLQEDLKRLRNWRLEP